MGENAEQELQNIRKLLRMPTPENLEFANQKLEGIAAFLASLKESIAAGQSCTAGLRKFLNRLPDETAAIRALMQAPLDFFRELNALRASKFGSYEHTGALRSFDLETTGKTLVHL